VSLVSGLRQTLRELGPGEAMCYWADRALDRLSGGHCRLVRYALAVQPLSMDEKRLATGGKFEIRAVDRAEAQHLDFDRPREIIDFRFEQQAHCIVAFRDGEIAGFIWVLTGAYHEDEVDCWFVPEPAGKVGWDLDVFVHPRYRVGTLFARLWAHANRYLLDQGCLASASRIAMTNHTSRAVHGRLGAREVRTASFLRLGPLQFTLVTRPFQFSTGRGAGAPRIAVPANALLEAAPDEGAA
jgi:GNAT superfamily N-acetyltransferase